MLLETSPVIPARLCSIDFALLIDFDCFLFHSSLICNYCITRRNFAHFTYINSKMSATVSTRTCCCSLLAWTERDRWGLTEGVGGAARMFFRRQMADLGGQNGVKLKNKQRPREGRPPTPPWLPSLPHSLVQSHPKNKDGKRGQGVKKYSEERKVWPSRIPPTELCCWRLCDTIKSSRTSE